MNGVEALWNHSHIIGFDLYALHISGGVRFFVFGRQPHGNGFPAERLHTHEDAPHIAADLFAVGKVVLCTLATLDDAKSFRPADNLYENWLNVGHVDILLSQFTIFCTVRNEECERNRIFHVVARI